MSDDDLPEILRPEPKQVYDANAAGYFRGVQDHKKPGPSADELGNARQLLLTPKQEAEYAERVRLAVDKTKRSGAVVNSATAVPGILMHSLKENNDLIDEFTPGKYQPQEAMKPPDQVKSKPGFFPKASVVLDICIDCVTQINPAAYIGGMTICMEEDSQWLAAHGIEYGALILYCICPRCDENAKNLGRNSLSLALVKGGILTSEEDIKIALKYGFPLQMHNGSEVTLGQWRMVERQERIMTNMYNYIKAEHQKPDSSVFRNKEKPNGN